MSIFIKKMNEDSINTMNFQFICMMQNFQRYKNQIFDEIFFCKQYLIRTINMIYYYIVK